VPEAERGVNEKRPTRAHAEMAREDMDPVSQGRMGGDNHNKSGLRWREACSVQSRHRLTGGRGSITMKTVMTKNS
jgi:hypothetical protein